MFHHIRSLSAWPTIGGVDEFRTKSVAYGSKRYLTLGGERRGEGARRAGAVSKARGERMMSRVVFMYWLKVSHRTLAF